MSAFHRVVVEVDEVASETRQDVEPIVSEVHALVRDAFLVLVGTTGL